MSRCMSAMVALTSRSRWASLWRASSAAVKSALAPWSFLERYAACDRLLQMLQKQDALPNHGLDPFVSVLQQSHIHPKLLL